MPEFKASSEILLAIGLANPEPIINLLDGSKFVTPLPCTAYSQMQPSFLDADQRETM